MCLGGRFCTVQCTAATTQHSGVDEEAMHCGWPRCPNGLVCHDPSGGGNLVQVEQQRLPLLLPAAVTGMLVCGTTLTGVCLCATGVAVSLQSDVVPLIFVAK